MLDVGGLAGVVDYDPSELVLTARPGTPVAEVTALLAAQGQQLAFEPPDLAPLWGGATGAGTLGGLVAAGLAGPRRIAAGGVRDHLLGFEAVNGLGEVFVAGGKVLKNVTGYDLPKVVAGSMGTLAALTEISIKALPAAATSGSLVLGGLAVGAALAAMTLALQGAVPVTGAAYLPGVPSRVVLRLEATSRVLGVQRDAVAAVLGQAGAWIEGDESRALWAAIGGVHGFAPDGEAWLWRICLPASHTPALLARLPGTDWQLDWGGALVWFWQRAGEMIDVRGVLAEVAGGRGHATLMRAPAAVRAELGVFEPLPPAHRALAERVRLSFDPHGVFNPRRREA